MVRAAAKNHDRVTVIVDPLDYAAVLDELNDSNGAVSEQTCVSVSPRRRMRTRRATTPRSPVIRRASRSLNRARRRNIPNRCRCSSASVRILRYGENPHQSAAFYAVPADALGASIGTAKQLQGKQLSYNNIADGDTALECVRQFEEPAW